MPSNHRLVSTIPSCRFLAKQFGALRAATRTSILWLSQPLGGAIPTSEQRVRLVNTEQALIDYVRLLRHIQVDEVGLLD